jgi:alkaline phosphatase D
MLRRFLPIPALLAALFAASTLAAQPGVAQASATRPYVVLVSLDGFRYDYAERYHADNLLAIGKAGAAAEGMIPSFPTVTFPNHISIVTGQYPEHHGVVGNSFWDSARQEMYSMNRSSTESAFYSYKPLWVVAEEQHVKAASMFWPTADSEIGGVRPTYWKLYDGHFPNEQRVAKVIEWLKLPEAERPHFITLYFDDVDSAGHRTGPDSAETEAAVHRVDKLVGELWAGIKALPLPIDLIVVSDHGMQTVAGSIDLSEFADLSKVRVVTEGPVALVYAPNPQTAEQVYAALKGKSPKFEVYRRKETPAAWHFSENPRIGDLVICVKEAISLTTGPPRERAEGRGPARPNSSRGAHGFDPGEFKTMQAIFYAVGPNVRPGVRLKPFENVDVFPFMVKILGLKSPAGVDGSEKTLDAAYRK